MQEIKKLLRHAFLILFVLSCSAKDNEKAQIKDQQNDSLSQSKIANTSDLKTSSNGTDTTIIISKKVITDSADLEYLDKCNEWNLTKSDIISVLNLSDTISGHDFHYLYYYLPCEIQGKIILKGTEFYFKLNSGSFLYLTNSDTSFYMGCAREECMKFFLEKGGEFEEEF